MQREFYQKLLQWKNYDNRKPLMVFGARQVGKTFIINDFCQNEFKQYHYVNLLQNIDIVNIYKENINSEDKFNKLKAFLNIDKITKDLVVFIDEIQESEELISDLKFICENHNDLNIVCAGSLLGVKLKRSHFSFPVGKVYMDYLYPMNFEEFLMAFNKQFLIDEIKNCYENNKPMIESYHNKCLNYYRLYLCSGGMPEAVKMLSLNEGDITKFDNTIIKNIVESYFNDMNKYVINKAESLKIEETYKSLPTQLGNTSNKFQANLVNRGSKLKDYELPIDWLLASKIVLKTLCAIPPLFPLRMHLQNDIYKLYISDVGILTYLLNIPYRDIYLNTNFLEKGIIAENYVAEELTNKGFDLIYWKSSRNAEIDFVIQSEDGIIPIDVKSADNNQSKSLKVFTDKYNPKYSIKVTTKNFGFNNNIKSVPLYAVFCIKK